jgi:hypothetical protein
MAKADSTSLSVSANERKPSEELPNENNGILNFFMRLCTRMCMDVEVAEDD